MPHWIYPPAKGIRVYVFAIKIASLKIKIICVHSVSKVLYVQITIVPYASMQKLRSSNGIEYANGNVAEPMSRNWSFEMNKLQSKMECKYTR